jgi:hypothetical protein
MMFFSPLYSNSNLQVILPVIKFTDYTSGNSSAIPLHPPRVYLNFLHSFFIRSIYQPELFWYHEPSSGAILASKNRRTRFVIRLADANMPLGAPMSNSDTVMIQSHTLTTIPKTTSAKSIHLGGRLMYGLHLVEDPRTSGVLTSLFSFGTFRRCYFGVDFANSEMGGTNSGPGFITYSTSCDGEPWEVV